MAEFSQASSRVLADPVFSYMIYDRLCNESFRPFHQLAVLPDFPPDLPVRTAEGASTMFHVVLELALEPVSIPEVCDSLAFLLVPPEPALVHVAIRKVILAVAFHQVILHLANVNFSSCVVVFAMPFEHSLLELASVPIPVPISIEPFAMELPVLVIAFIELSFPNLPPFTFLNFYCFVRITFTLLLR